MVDNQQQTDEDLNSSGHLHGGLDSLGGWETLGDNNNLLRNVIKNKKHLII